MWAVGCILAELLGRKPLFPGKDYVDMLKMIVTKIGNPAIEDQVSTPSFRGCVELGRIGFSSTRERGS